MKPPKNNMRFSETHWMVVLIIAFVLTVGIGKLEGRFYPAAKPMILTRIVPAPALKNNLAEVNPVTGFFIQGNSFRLRPSCDFRDLKWFIGKRDGRSVPTIIELESAIIRDDGFFEFGPWWVAVKSYKEFSQNSFANAYHQCKIFGFYLPYYVVSPFWN